MSSERTSGRPGTTGGAGADVEEQFRAVLDTEERRLAAASHRGDLLDWRSRVIREVMDHRSPYAEVLRRGHHTSRRNEFLQGWKALIAEALERISPACDTDARVASPEKVAIAILAALHGGATLSRLAEDARSLEAALDIALAPAFATRGPGGHGDRRAG